MIRGFSACGVKRSPTVCIFPFLLHGICCILVISLYEHSPSSCLGSGTLDIEASSLVYYIRCGSTAAWSLAISNICSRQLSTLYRLTVVGLRKPQHTGIVKTLCLFLSLLYVVCDVDSSVGNRRPRVCGPPGLSVLTVLRRLFYSSTLHASFFSL